MDVNRLRRLCFFMNGVLFTGAAELFDLDFIVLPLSAREMIILVLALRASDDDGDSFGHIMR